LEKEEVISLAKKGMEKRKREKYMTQLPKWQKVHNLQKRRCHILGRHYKEVEPRSS